MKSPHPGPFREPINRDDRPRRYARAFLEDERAHAWTRAITAEHYQRFGFAPGCRHASARNDG